MRGEANVKGVRLPFDRKILSTDMRRRLAKGKYEASEVKASASVLQQGDVVLELGAGLGFVSSYLRKNTGAGRIICVEANPHLIPYIQRVHQLNDVGGVQVLHGIAQPMHGGTDAAFYCRKDFWASSLEPEPPFESIVSVPCIPFTDLLTHHRPDLLVMDIEGGELQLLAVEALQGVRSIVLEVHPKIYGESGLAQVQNHLARLSFRPTKNPADRDVLIYHRV